MHFSSSSAVGDEVWNSKQGDGTIFSPLISDSRTLPDPDPPTSPNTEAHLEAKPSVEPVKLNFLVYPHPCLIFLGAVFALTPTYTPPPYPVPLPLPAPAVPNSQSMLASTPMPTPS